MADEHSAEQRNSERLGASEAMRRSIVVNLMELKVSERVSLVDDAIAEAVDNPRDGSWIIVKYIESPSDPSKIDSEEPVFAGGRLRHRRLATAVAAAYPASGNLTRPSRTDHAVLIPAAARARRAIPAHAPQPSTPADPSLPLAHP